MEAVRDRVIGIMAEVLKVSTDVLQDDVAIGDIPEWDSLHHIQLVSAIEKAFDFRFTPDVMMDLEDVEDIVNAVELRVNQ
ncbi:MAG: acyl carrier protein [Lachnospiraceae bacterium]|nr:acyl carrier protein [Lachnospiraceae bacterium]